MVKRLGNTLAVEWRAKKGLSGAAALQEAVQSLVDQGYRRRGQDVFALAASDLPRGRLVILRTHYRTLLGKERTSYGCGFSPVSEKEAEKRALRNLHTHDWGWKPDKGYEVVESRRF